MSNKSILQGDERQCVVSGSTEMLDRHHVFHGIRRNASEKYGCWVLLRHDIHMRIHEGHDNELDMTLKKACQKRFEDHYGHDQFMLIFGKNYLD